MATILVTGANGFIGSHLVRALLAKRHDVRCLVRSTSDLASLRELPVHIYLGDLTDPETLVRPVTGAEYIYHLGAVLMGTSGEEFDASNTVGTVHLLVAAGQHARKTLKRFLYVSSEAAAGPRSNANPRTEADLSTPMSWYGWSKDHAEEAVKDASEHLPVTIVRPSSVYGERERDVSQIYWILEYRLHPVPGIETKRMVMVYVGDLVEGMIRAAESRKTLGRTYFLNHPEILSAHGVVKTIARAMGKPRGLTLRTPIWVLTLVAPFAELIHHFTRGRAKLTRDKAREISQRFWVASPARAKIDFGWEAGHSLLEGMTKTVAWYREEQREIRSMARERRGLRWFKFVVIGALIGAAIEAASLLGDFYWYTPPWLVYPVVLGGFGAGMGSLSLWVRTMNGLKQFLIGTAVVGAAECLNEIAFHAWQFAQGWPLGITDPWVRTAVLAVPGGLVVLIVNAVMRSLYRRRLRLG